MQRLSESILDGIKLLQRRRLESGRTGQVADTLLGHIRQEAAEK